MKSVGVSMPEKKMQTATGMCVVDLTKYLMNKYNLSQDVAFAKLQGTVLFSLLNNQDSGLLFEQNEYLFEALDIELDKGPEALNSFFMNYK